MLILMINNYRGLLVVLVNIYVGVLTMMIVILWGLTRTCKLSMIVNVVAVRHRTSLRYWKRLLMIV